MSIVSSAPTGGRSSSLADVIDTVLDKGIVIDAHVSVALVGIEVLTINARVVVASVDTYLRFAEAANRLDLKAQEGRGLGDLVEGAVAGPMKRRAIEHTGERLLEKAGEVIGEIVRPPERERQRDRQGRRDS
ncbi:gas vesicle protein [Dactylosporangium roseum]|uniref:Gas vesicle protein A n=1 Tax=Dactylosporangium roseum TaxID=47989 RepID=A0ABY5YXB7_9ACTN|nr:gas vesicle protein GvpJ [Dactylosporangium roseum]UWZ33435.1 gas vesicle protein [Dactylosporangium roseum]